MNNIRFKLSAIILLITCFGVVGCSVQEQTDSQIELNKYEELGEELSANFNFLSDELRAKNSNFGDIETVKAIAKNYYGEDSDEALAFSNAYDKQLYGERSKSTELGLNEVQKERVNYILSYKNKVATFSDYKVFLENEFEKIANSEMSDFDKKYLLSYITFYKAGLSFINSNVDLLQLDNISKEKLQGWWDDWGRCAAGIVGGVLVGAGTVALASALAPATGGGSLVGAYTLLTVGGGLTGAASSC